MNNIFMVVGRLTKDIELRYTKDNKAVCDVNLAINNAKDDVTFLKVSIWNKVAETTAKYCKKGDLLGVSGIIKNHNWEDEEGNKHYDYNFLASKITFLSTKKEEHKENTTNNTITHDDLQDDDPFTQYANEVEITDDMLD